MLNKHVRIICVLLVALFIFVLSVIATMHWLVRITSVSPHGIYGSEQRLYREQHWSKEQLAVEDARLDRLLSFQRSFIARISPLETLIARLQPSQQFIGVYNGKSVKEEFWCEDICPNYGSYLLLYQDVKTEEECKNIGGGPIGPGVQNPDLKYRGCRVLLGDTETEAPDLDIAHDVQQEVAAWNSYTYSSIESGILPDLHFKYPPLFGNNPTLISSRNTNRPGNISEDWGGFFEFNPTGAFGDRGLRVEFFKRLNSENNFESYISKSATSGGWDSPKYFKVGSYKAARIRFTSSSHYDADVGWYFVELSNKTILTISTSGDKKFLYDDDQTGNSTRDKIISTLVIGQ